jgi:hypothetical protein
VCKASNKGDVFGTKKRRKNLFNCPRGIPQKQFPPVKVEGRPDFTSIKRRLGKRYSSLIPPIKSNLLLKKTCPEL